MNEPMPSGDANTPSPAASAPSIEMNATPSPEAAFFVQMVTDDYRAGRMTREQADGALKEINGEGISQLEADKRTDSQRQFDAIHEPGQPNDYTFPAYQNPESITAEQTAFDKTARGWLATGLFPKEQGSFIAKEAVRLAKQMDGWDDWRHENFQKIEMNVLTNIWREDTAKNIAVCQAFIKELDARSAGKLIPFLNASGIGNSSALVIQIFNQANRLAIRNGKA
jgi:hypothetical protein